LSPSLSYFSSPTRFHDRLKRVAGSVVIARYAYRTMRVHDPPPRSSRSIWLLVILLASNSPSFGYPNLVSAPADVKYPSSRRSRRPHAQDFSKNIVVYAQVYNRLIKLFI